MSQNIEKNEQNIDCNKCIHAGEYPICGDCEDYHYYEEYKVGVHLHGVNYCGVTETERKGTNYED